MLALNVHILGSRLLDEVHHRAHGDHLLLRSFSEVFMSVLIIPYFTWRYRSWTAARHPH